MKETKMIDQKSLMAAIEGGKLVGVVEFRAGETDFREGVSRKGKPYEMRTDTWHVEIGGFPLQLEQMLEKEHPMDKVTGKPIVAFPKRGDFVTLNVEFEEATDGEGRQIRGAWRLRPTFIAQTASTDAKKPA